MKLGKTQIRKQIKNIIFYIIVLLLAFSVYLVEGVNSDSKVLITNMLIIMLSLIFMLVGDTYNYSLNKIFMLFSFFFFGIAPILQYQYGTTMWGGKPFDDSIYLKMNIIIIIILLLYQGSYYILSRIRYSDNHKKAKNNKSEEILISKKSLLLLSLISMIITLYFHEFNFTRLFFRGDSDTTGIAINQSLSLIYFNFIRPIPIVALVLFKINNLKDRKSEVLLWMIILLTNFPTSAARFYIAAIYIPLVILYIKQFNKKYLLLNKLLLVGLLFVFPFLEQARKFNSLSDFKFSLDFQMFVDGHFDSFQMFMRVVDENYITKGSQLFTTIFFFIPRAIWSSKSVGSGSLMAEKLRFSFDNISMNYFGEGYINFGYFGILIFIFAIAYVNAKLDKKYWRNLNNYNKMSPYYLFLIGLEFFILRGDLLSSFAFTMGLLSSIYFVTTVSTKKVKVGATKKIKIRIFKKGQSVI